MLEKGKGVSVTNRKGTEGKGGEGALAGDRRKDGEEKKEKRMGEEEEGEGLAKGVFPPFSSSET